MKPKKIIPLLMLAFALLFACEKDEPYSPDNENDNTENPNDANGDNDFKWSISHSGVLDGIKGSEGTMTVKCNYSDGELTISEIVVKYEISHFFGEPTWMSVLKWEGAGDLSSVRWAAEVLGQDDVPVEINGKKVYCSITGGTIPEAGEGYGWDVKGSPSWADVFKFYDSNTKELVSGISADEAKAIYMADFVLGNITILNINGKNIE
jgi:hypothetical protein